MGKISIAHSVKYLPDNLVAVALLVVSFVFVILSVLSVILLPTDDNVVAVVSGLVWLLVLWLMKLICWYLLWLTLV